MQIRSLTFEVVETEQGLRLRITGRPYGLESEDLTPEEVTALGRHLTAEAERLVKGRSTTH